MGVILEKLLDLFVDKIIDSLFYILKIIPIKISPKRIDGHLDQEWGNIFNIEIKNRLNSNLYNILIGGVSKEKFAVEIISENPEIKGKTVKFMNINTDRIIVHAQDKRTNDFLWIIRIHKLSSREIINLRLKIKNKRDIYFKTFNFNWAEIPIKENNRGIVSVPFDYK